MLDQTCLENVQELKSMRRIQILGFRTSCLDMLHLCSQVLFTKEVGSLVKVGNWRNGALAIMGVLSLWVGPRVSAQCLPLLECHQ